MLYTDVRCNAQGTAMALMYSNRLLRSTKDEMETKGIAGVGIRTLTNMTGLCHTNCKGDD